MSLFDLCLIRSRGPAGQVVVRLGVPLADDYLEFMEGRCRPDTVLAAAYDLRVFFGVAGKPPAEVRPVDVLGFITAQRTGRSASAGLHPVDDGPGGVATSTVTRRLSIVSAGRGPRGARRRAGLDHAASHELRHTCLTRLREAGMALEAVQAQAGLRQRVALTHSVLDNASFRQRQEPARRQVQGRPMHRATALALGDADIHAESLPASGR